MLDEFTRSRIYYTKAQIQNGLITSGKEWMFIDYTEYIGQYHTYTTNEIFSESTFVKGKSRLLIPYVEQQYGISGIGQNRLTNFEYDGIKKVDVKPSQIPNKGQEPITDEDRKNNYFVRYFAYRRNDGRCLELNKKKFGKIGTKESLDGVMWEKVKIKWKFKGNLHDVVDENGNITESGVFDTNKRTVSLISEKYPNLRNKLINYTELYES
jgi:hypothetical protein|tara:strand:- start:116 stop:748 length:633 start_codon:yes stop_codon:yes gene_type:complete